MLTIAFLILATALSSLLLIGKATDKAEPKASKYCSRFPDEDSEF